MRAHRAIPWLAGSLLFAAALLLAGCQRGAPLPFRLTQVTGHMPDLDFKLVNDDGKPATGFELPKLRERWRTDKSGTVATLTVKRGTETKKFAVTLRDLI